MVVIQARGLSKDYGNGRGVLELDLDIQAGEVYGFIGPNGAGKSTTIRTLLDLLRPTAGHARIFGLDHREHAAKIQSRIGYMPGELELPGGWNARTFLHDLATIRGGVPRGRIERLVQRLGANVDDKIRRLSKGNKQKIGIIQAFMHEPDLLILDEPTDGLDPLLRREVQGLILEAKARGATVFLSSHVMSEVEEVCDRVGIIRDSRLIASGSLKELRRDLVRTVRLRFARPIKIERLPDIPGVVGHRQKGPLVEVKMRGPTGPLIAALAGAPLIDMDIRHEDLEDVVMQYYGVRA